MEENRAVLETRNLGITFGGLKALEGVHFRLHEKEIIGLIGPNGAGKTTVFNLLTDVYYPTDGEIELEGNSIVGKKPTRSRKTALRGPSRISVCLKM